MGSVKGQFISLREHRQQQVRDAVEYLTNYMITYSNQHGYENFSDETIIDDVLYGLGVALWGRANHEGPSGYDRTVVKLLEHLEKHR